MKKIVIIGIGSRGLGYAEEILVCGQDEIVVGVVDPNKDRIKKVLQLFPNIEKDMIFKDWKDFIKKKRNVDAVVIATQDNMHTEPAIACADLGYHILLEKPMAPTLEECKKIVEAAEKNNVMLTVCHVLRYTKFFKKLHELIHEKKIIGDLIHIQHFENVGYWHMAHSYVRGNWNNTNKTSSMLLAKSCHDIDILRFLVGKKCKKVHSFGSLLHFHRERKPKKAGEAKRCINCAHEPKCVYSALKIYMRDHFDRGWRRWPLTILTNDINEDNLIKAIETGPYGRCVYECDNNVVDHQVVNLEYEGGVTAGFTMSGFNIGGREIIIQGSEMVLRGNMNTNEIILTDFLGEEVFRININPDGSDFHGGGDKALVQEWLEALQTGDQSKITTGPRESWKAIRRFLWRKNQG